MRRLNSFCRIESGWGVRGVLGECGFCKCRISYFDMVSETEGEFTEWNVGMS